MKRDSVIHYGRVSGKGQVEGDGNIRQQKATQQFCDASGLVIAQWFFDAGVSGTIEGMARPELMDAVEYAIAQGCCGLVVERMDRIARDLMVQELFIRELKKHGLKLYSADQGFVDMTNDTEDPTRKLIRQLMGALAEWEKSVTVKKLKVARDRIKAEKGRCEGAKPYGHFLGEQHTLNVMRSMRYGGASFDSIASFLNGSEVKTRSGKSWNAGRVYEIIGRRQRKGEEAIVN